MINKLKEIIQRYDEVTALLGQNEIASNPTKYNELAKEHHELKPIAKKGEKFIESINELNEYEEIIKENDLYKKYEILNSYTKNINEN